MKKLLYIIAGLLVIGGIAFALTSSGWLQGRFVGSDPERQTIDGDGDSATEDSREDALSGGGTSGTSGSSSSSSGKADLSGGGTSGTSGSSSSSSGKADLSGGTESSSDDETSYDLGDSDSAEPDAEDYLTLAEEYLDLAYEANGEAADWMSEAEGAADSGDADFLAESKTEAQNAADLADEYATEAQNAADGAYDVYQYGEAYQAWLEANATLNELNDEVSSYWENYETHTKNAETARDNIDLLQYYMEDCQNNQDPNTIYGTPEELTYIVDEDFDPGACESGNNADNDYLDAINNWEGVRDNEDSWAKTYYEAWQSAVDEYDTFVTDTLPPINDAKEAAEEENKGFADKAQEYADEAQGFADEAQGFADTAASYTITEDTGETTTTTTYTCSTLDISPDTYEIAYDATEVGDVEFTVNIALTESQVTSWNIFPSLWQAFSLTDSYSASLASFNLSHTGSGTITDSTGSTISSLINVGIHETSYSDTFTYSGGTVGDTITATFWGDSSCSDTLTITQASEPVDPTDTTTDTDGDGLTDYEETNNYGTNPSLADTDGDGLSDYDEIMTHKTDPTLSDSDSDGMDDGWEIRYGLDPLTNNANEDPDADGYTNLDEYTNGTDPTVSNKITDTTTDTDGDGLTDYEETNTYGTNPSLADTDGDGLSDYDEIMTHKTDPTLSDSDSDGMDDGWEIRYGLDPLTDDSRQDPDEDGYTNIQEYNKGTNPKVPNRTDEEVDEIISSPSYICNDPFIDTNGHWAEDLICRLYQAGTVSGYAASPNSFGPNNEITRAEWIKVLVKTAGYDESYATGKTENFTDVTDTDWYSNYVIIAENLDVIRTRDTGEYFNPNVPITRADAILYTVRMADQQLWGWDANDITFSDVYTTDYFAYAVVIANITTVDVPNEGTTPVIEGSNGKFRPYDYITRAEAVAVAMRSYLAWFR